MRIPASVPFIVTAVSSGVAGFAFIYANAFPYDVRITMHSTTVTSFHYRSYGWPSIYATVEGTSYGPARSPPFVDETRFRLWALLVNLALISSVSALIWTTYFILRTKRLSLAILFLVITCIAVLVASIAQVGESSLLDGPNVNQPRIHRCCLAQLQVCLAKIPSKRARNKDIREMPYE